MLTLKNVIITIASVALIGIGVNAFAHMGGGWGHHGAGMYDQDRSGTGYYDNQLSKEDYKKFEQKREAFFKETQDIRTSLLEKERQLQSELAKSEPDAASYPPSWQTVQGN